MREDRRTSGGRVPASTLFVHVHRAGEAQDHPIGHIILSMKSSSQRDHEHNGRAPYEWAWDAVCCAVLCAHRVECRRRRRVRATNHKQ